MAKYHCNYCQGDIYGFRIKCSECPDFDLCLQCFSCGAESGTHKRDHDYHIAGDDDTSVGAFDIPKPWSLVEEMMLLDAVEQYGFGNWEDVANHVESRKGPECEEHYVKFFIQGTIGREILCVDTIGSNVTDHSCPDGGPLSPSITVPISPLDLNIQEQHELGYMPYRDDFEREHDNEAETLVSSLANNYDDEDIDVAVKLAQVDRYRTRLKERERRKCVAREYNLIQAATTLGKQKCQTPKKKMSKEDKDLQEKVKVFSQFHSLAEHEAFLENIQKEKELKTRIKSLMRYRKNGITKLDDIEHFEEEKFKRDKKRDNKKKLGNCSPLIKRGSMVSKKAAAVIEEKLDILIDDEESKDEDEENDSKEMAAFPGYDMLSERERKLCNSIGMTPGNYLTIKTCIIKDYLQRRQGLPKIKIRYPSGLDKTHRRKIMSFLTDNGWIGVT
ncbi:transcriptional adapter 2-beta-like [Pecten maximus]|uniref:transcriptional adapter 2-beta-like n=1 Tax=Pecten maximus TaxID=6579 RepID=UPI001458A688|nr:transcriptional adapter 2-beta-like [Pecten maximus]